MDNFWDILVPIVVIGSIFLGVFAENRKNVKKPTPSLPPQTPGEHIEPVQELFPDLIPTPIEEPAPKIIETPKQMPKRKTEKRQPKQDMPGDNTKRVTPQEDKVYSQEQSGEAGNAMDDIRRAVIAHEILKRKF